MSSAAPTQPLADVKVPREEISQLLKSLGVCLDTTLAESHLLGAYDTLAAIEIASAVETAELAAPALRRLHTWATPQPEPVRLSQQLLLQHAPADALSPKVRKYFLDLLASAPVWGD